VCVTGGGEETEAPREEWGGKTTSSRETTGRRDSGCRKRERWIAVGSRLSTRASALSSHEGVSSSRQVRATLHNVRGHAACSVSSTNWAGETDSVVRSRHACSTYTKEPTYMYMPPMAKRQAAASGGRPSPLRYCTIAAPATVAIIALRW